MDFSWGNLLSGNPAGSLAGNSAGFNSDSLMSSAGSVLGTIVGGPIGGVVGGLLGDHGMFGGGSETSSAASDGKFFSGQFNVGTLAGSGGMGLLIIGGLIALAVWFFKD